RYFLDKVVTRIFAFEKETIRQYEGNYSDYMENRNSQLSTSKIEENGKEEKVKTEKVKNKKLKFSYQEQKDFNEIDERIQTLEEKIEEVEEKMQKEASNYEKLSEWTKEKEELEQQLEEKMDQWVYLNDLAEKMEKENAKN
ncbi:MAG: ABC transporter ATP-binding protein, partial [Acetivibrio sp.]